MITSYIKYTSKLNESSTTFHIPSYEEAKQIADAGVGFYESVYDVDGYKISIFNYRITTYADFERFFHLGSKEMRGITFVFDNDGSIYKRFIMLQKFWNIGENPGNTLEDFKKKKILNVMKKEDGSLITFIELPNGKIVGKTKQGFTNEQSDAANKIYNENNAIKQFVNYCIKNNLAAMFEYVSFSNRIVLKYEKTDLILIRVRNNETGEYIDIRSLDTPGITPCPFEEKYTELDQMLADAEFLEDIEGWVIQFDDYSMGKQKTKWYFQKHRLMDSISRENDIIQLILDEKIDDVIADLSDKDTEAIAFINNIISIVNKYIHDSTTDVQKLVDSYHEIENRISNATGVPDDASIKDKMIRKEFALTYNKNKFFGLAIQICIGGKDMFDVIKEHILRITKNLEDSRRWIKNNS